MGRSGGYCDVGVGGGVAGGELNGDRKGIRRPEGVYRPASFAMMRSAYRRSTRALNARLVARKARRELWLLKRRMSSTMCGKHE